MTNIIDLGGCSLHHVHNVASYAISAADCGVEELVKEIFCFFKYSWTQKEIFAQVIYYVLGLYFEAYQATPQLLVFEMNKLHFL